MRPGVSPDETLQGPVAPAGERAGEPDRERHAERVAEPGRVFDRRHSLLARNAEADGPAVREQLLGEAARIGVLDARGDLLVRELAERAKEVVQVIRRPRAAAFAEALQLELDLRQRAGVQQLSQLLRPEQLSQQVPIQCQRGGAALGERRVALVHVDADPPEQQRLREGRRVLRVHGDEPRSSGPEIGHDLAEGRDVEHVAEALARGLQQDREVGELRSLGEEIGRALSLLPERRALTGAAARQQERPRRRLPEHAGEHRGLRHGGDDRLFDPVGIEQEVLGRDPIDGLRQTNHDAVVAPEHLGAGPEALEHPALDRHRPRRVHAGPERREDAHPPVADLVAEALDDDGAVVGHGAGRLHLLFEVGHEVPRREVVQTHVATQALERLVPACPAQRPREGADGATELDRTPRLVPVPERHPPLLARAPG